MFKSKILVGSKETLHKKGAFITEKDGVSQGNILSPILCNIYLTKLDRFVEHLRKKYEKGIRSTVNGEYLKVVKLSIEELKLPKGERARIIHYRKKLAMNKGLRYTLLDDSFVRIKYVRYADDFIVGVRACKEVAVKIRKEITFFLNSTLHLEVNEEKTRLINTYHDKAQFLGTYIHNVPTDFLPFRSTREKQQKIKEKSRIVGLLAENFRKKGKIIWELLKKELGASYHKAEANGKLQEYKKTLKSTLNVLLPCNSIKKNSRA